MAEDSGSQEVLPPMSDHSMVIILVQPYIQTRASTSVIYFVSFLSFHHARH